MSSSNYCQELIQDFEKALENYDNCDVIIKTGEHKELRAHSFVLRARCSYFKKALSSDWEERDDNGNYILKKPNISTEVFQLILRYLYTGVVDCDQLSKDIILQSLVAADELGLDKLIECIQECLLDNKEFINKDPISTLQVIYQHEPFEDLKNYCLEIISENPRMLFSSEKFPSLEKPIITMILQRDDLNMEEIDIWDSLLRWLFVHYLKINKDHSTWSLEDLKNVKQTIKEYIPLIRFHDISKEDFYLKVYPYKDLLPQDLLDEILRYHMAPYSTPKLNFKPSRSRRIDSVLIRFNIFKLIAKWIDKKDDDYTQQNMPYQFTLLLRGTRDGFDSAKFHQLCDSKGATITFARIENSKQIIGGYNPIDWYQNSAYGSTNDSFLFNITDIDNLDTAKIGRCNNSSYAVYHHASYGPTFGSGHDLNAQGKTWYTNNGNAYTNISMPNNSFTVDEYEVFQVLKKS
ncbi:hypothetical protein GLOIN_2v1766367 [Rhizophagus irregularis DAOM 181602=DAOM 197198]|uniref:Uncharacterized protein n=2 Tax=Rhizophagus irregularis TaxID=588596 RepID=U9TFB4_RHIID|nr:hypothetical protein GLOIN_2v1766367 [Rhizophagus irregularis DAOM 181602=DAOM 197198]EXX51721.1 hypothetical protein RirG_259400 [Rhizophagus irregularis DAOM 197198w]POG78752.1 hypothetical protein GLOIN_2v1766367 [Rhizophagus irregularis DAOM 181602=DAOM 197198]GBC51945.1 hypothetical protein GLOIN_2v1766367 [Rhizophagus irregularis DAOM 181602=DAOM 197198]|eukprot:XP_025185618.1 hypothetical protein GLOIN_2v1766367 [Rhizophagus irregularis DAOM 181602=DAOM 197198]